MSQNRCFLTYIIGLYTLNVYCMQTEISAQFPNNITRLIKAISNTNCQQVNSLLSDIDASMMLILHQNNTQPTPLGYALHRVMTHDRRSQESLKDKIFILLALRNKVFQEHDPTYAMINAIIQQAMRSEQQACLQSSPQENKENLNCLKQKHVLFASFQDSVKDIEQHLISAIKNADEITTKQLIESYKTNHAQHGQCTELEELAVFYAVEAIKNHKPNSTATKKKKVAILRLILTTFVTNLELKELYRDFIQ